MYTGHRDEVIMKNTGGDRVRLVPLQVPSHRVVRVGFYSNTFFFVVCVLFLKLFSLF